MLNDRQQFERRNAILRILRGGVVHRQSDLAQLLRRDGFDVTQSSVSRDLRELGVLKASGRYRVPADEISRANGDFGALAPFVRAVKPAGASITVIKTSIGAAPSVAVAVDKAEWPEVVGTISVSDLSRVAPEQWNQTTVHEMMDRDATRVTEDSDLSEALRLLVRERGTQMLLVVDDAGALQGIVTKTDILRAVGMASGAPRH